MSVEEIRSQMEFTARQLWGEERAKALWTPHEKLLQRRCQELYNMDIWMPFHPLWDPKPRVYRLTHPD